MSTYRWLFLMVMLVALPAGRVPSQQTADEAEASATPELAAGKPGEEAGSSAPKEEEKAGADDPEKSGDADPAMEEKKEEAVAGAPPAALPAKPVNGGRQVVHGWVEYVFVGEEKIKVKAKLDTGAKTSSIHAEEVTMFERDGAKWMRFIFRDPPDAAKRTEFERPLVRVARVKITGGGSEPRYVVALPLEVGEKRLMVEFTLNDRENMIYPVLLGRSALRHLGPVDAGRTHLHRP